jgi:hypothetical protein
MNFTNELLFLNEFRDENVRVTLNNIQTAKIIKQYPNVPLEYISYLEEIGAGTLMSFKVYENLTDFEDLGLSELYSLPNEIKLFGDNFSGDFAGFDLSKNNSDEVVEFWHDSNRIYHTGKTFRQYIRTIILYPSK